MSTFPFFLYFQKLSLFGPIFNITLYYFMPVIMVDFEFIVESNLNFRLKLTLIRSQLNSNVRFLYKWTSYLLIMSKRKHEKSPILCKKLLFQTCTPIMDKFTLNSGLKITLFFFPKLFFKNWSTYSPKLIINRNSVIA